VSEWCIPDVDADHGPCADDETVEEAYGRAEGFDLLVSVGAGTVNDVVKLAAHRRELPFFSVPTAASMNGYTSAIAAILSGGVKRTIPTGQVSAIFADTSILRAAPKELTLAGFGDLVSKPYSNACWYLSSIIAGGTRSDAPAALLDEPFKELLKHAKGIGAGEPAAMEALLETLLLSGCAMALAGSSSPASGGEHLISHYWDMVAHANGRPLRALHGTQVGIATLVVGKLYAGILAAENDFPSDVERAWSWPSSDFVLEGRVRGRHPELPEAVLNEVVKQSLQKYVDPSVHRERLWELGRFWPEIRKTLTGMLIPYQEIETALKDAGALTDASAIGVDDEGLAHTVLVARDIRARYTVLDLAEDLGILGSFCDMIRKGMLPNWAS
jgi:glycerol-1-phosphate dehydrogenase [NAD(P)+]